LTGSDPQLSGDDARSTEAALRANGPKPGPTVRDVAKRAHVHPATVSRVLDPAKRHRISDETARRVEKAAKDLGYRRNHLARGLRMRKSFAVGVVIPDLTNPIYPPIVRGIADSLESHGYTALIVNTDAEPDRELRYLTAIDSWPVEGFIAALGSASRPAVEELMRKKIPLVLINRTFDGLQADAVTPDDRHGAALAVDHLVALGHRSIAHIAGPLSLSPGKERYRGFIQAMREHGLSVPDHLVKFADSFKRGAAMAAASDLLAQTRCFTAVFAAADMLALDTVDALRAVGLECPDDVSVIGFDDVIYADRFTPPLTTIHSPHFEIGQSAGQLLLDQLTTGRDSPRTVVLPTQLMVRGSTARPATGVSDRGRRD
jgi:LacI family transcriptional regulator